MAYIAPQVLAALTKPNKLSPRPTIMCRDTPPQRGKGETHSHNTHCKNHIPDFFSRVSGFISRFTDLAINASQPFLDVHCDRLLSLTIIARTVHLQVALLNWLKYTHHKYDYSLEK
eukprot:442296-Amphidinium_carterae.1